MSGTPSVLVRGLSVERRGRTVIRDLSCSVAAGRVTGLVGPSGSGKTTLMRAVVGVQQVTAGEIVVLGEPAGSATLRRRIGYMPQAPSVYEDLTVLENLRYFADILGARRRVATVLATVGLEPNLAARVRDLSGGERSRVSLGVALLGAPDLLVLDEPTVGLDPLLRRDLWTSFRALAAEGTTLLVSTHVMDEAERCDDLLLLRDGALLAAGSPSELRSRAGASSLEAAFIALTEAA